MDSYDKSYMDIDELAKKIEMRIKELEKLDTKKEEKLEYCDKKTQKHIVELDEIIREIDSRIEELERKEKENIELNVDDLTKKINKKLEKLEDISEDDLGKTIYDLSEISNSINEVMKTLEAKRKRKKQLKAKYCDLARKKAKDIKKKKNKKVVS